MTLHRIGLTAMISARVAIMYAFIPAAGPAARAQRPSPAIGELNHVAWTIRDGAPSSVYALTQSADGTLWIGTTTGLYQFDGVRFELFEPPSGAAMPSLNVSALVALPDGKLWIGYSRGGASVLAGGQLVSYGERDGLPAGGVTALAVDSVGDVWAATTTGLGRFRNGRWQDIGPESGYPGGMTSDLLVDRRGTLWAAATPGVFVLARGDIRFTARAPSLDPAGGGGGMPREAPDGSVWGASVTLGLTRLSDAAGGPTATRAEAGRLRDARGLLIDQHSNAWLMVNLDLVRVPLVRSSDRGQQSGTGQPLPVTRVPLPGGSVPTVLLEDREGNIWVGTNRGLNRFRETKLTPVIFPGPISYPALAAGDRGAIWVGSFSDSPLVSVGDRIAVHRGGPDDISCAYRDLRGGVWLGGAAGLWHAPAGGSSLGTARFSRVALPAETGTGDVQAIAYSLDGDLWVSVRGPDTRGVFRRRGRAWSRIPEPPGMSDQIALTIVVDSAGRTWLGYPQNLVVLVTADSTRMYAEADGIQLGAVTAMFVRGARVWVGGEYGLMVLEGERFRPIEATIRLRAITGIVETGNGDLWLNGAGGVTHIDAGQLRRALQDSGYRALAERLDYDDGLDGQPQQVRPFPTAIEGTDGRLWFATESGVAWLDPTNIKRNGFPPPVQIRAVSAAGQRYPAGNPIALPPGTRDLEIAYAAMSLAMPNRVRFRYRLSESDTSWQEPGGRREAYYTNLKPGSYHFHVIAANEDGVWNESGDTLEFTIPPSFIQSRWFVALWASALGALVWVAYRMRVRRVAAGLRTRYEAALSERTRIAQELHDTLLQGFTGITIQLRAIQRVLTQRPAEGAAALETVLASADTSLRDARNAIWDMRAVELEGRDLPEAFEGAVRSVVSGAPVALEFSVRGERRPLAPQVETTALRIGREAVLNAVKHADARKIDVRLEYGPHSLLLQVVDDGRGMASGTPRAATTAGHFGIAGMGERAHRLGGTMQMSSAPGRGTSVRVSLPLD